MPSVRGAAGLTARTLGVLLVVAVVVVCALWGMNLWKSAALQEIKAQTYVDAALPSAPPSVGISSRGLRPGVGSSGDIAVRVQRRPDRGWQVITRYRLRLRASDPLVEKLRSRPQDIGEVIDVLPGGYATAKDTDWLASDVPPDRATPNWCTLSQSVKDSHVVVAAEYVGRINSAYNIYYSYDLSYKLYDSENNSGVLARLPGQWSWSLEAPPPWGLRVEGRPETQTAHAVRFKLTQHMVHARVSIESPNDNRVLVVSDSSMLPGFKALFSVLGLLAATSGALMGFVRTGASALLRRRGVWAISLSFTLLTCAALATTAWDVYHASWTELSWLVTLGYYSGFSPDDLSSATELEIQGALLGTLLFALPSLAVSTVYALRANRPPPTASVLVVTAPAPAFVCTAWAMGGSAWTPPVAGCLLGASVAASWVFATVWLGFGGRAARGWALALAAAVWAGVASTVALQYVPWEFEPLESRVPVAFVYRSLLASWPLTLLCLTPWVVALLLLAGPLLPGGHGARRAGRIGLGLLLSVGLIPWWSQLGGQLSLGEQLSGVPPTRVLLTQLVGQDPGDIFLTGAGVIAPALQVIWLAAVVVVLSHLRNGGTTKGHWQPSARPGCIALLLLAAAAPIVGDPLNWLPHWTTSAALLAACAGAHLLLPATHGERAARLHRISGADHARLMHSLARALLFAEGRHRFLIASRATLADTSVKPDEWEEKWRRLRAPTATDAAQETAKLRAVALGGSGGHPPWANGLAAAAVSGLLTLPWTAWPAWQGRGYSGIPEAVTVAGSTTAVWLAHGFTYGYLYPWIRGRGPVTKASWLWASMCPIQLLLFWPRLRLPFGQNALTAFLLLAQGAVMTLGLALYWEMRLIHRADLRWGHIRNFRRLSSLATPVSTVLVAAVAAAVTVLATAWANDLTAPQETHPSPASSSSTEPP